MCTLTSTYNEITLSDGTSAFVTGEGAPVVLLHGVGLDRHVWAAQVAALSATHHVVTYDLLGHGKSPAAPENAALGDWVAQLQRAADELQFAHFSLVGFSFGGLIAQGFAMAHPERLDRLVLMSTIYDRSGAERDSVAARLKQARQESPRAIIAAALDRWFSPDFAAKHPGVIANYRSLLEGNDEENFLAAYACFASADRALAGKLGAIRCPTLVLTGELDGGSTPAMARKMADAIANASLSILPGARHMMPVEMAGAVNAELGRFLNGGTS